MGSSIAVISPTLLKSFQNDSHSFIKNTDETQIEVKRKKKKDKKTLLPDIKGSSKRQHNESYDSNHDKNMKTYMKLPNIYRNAYNKQILKNESKFYNSNEFKNQMKHNISNSSIDMQKTQYLKPKKNMVKKMQELKKAYISPYSLRIMRNHLKS